MINVDIIPKEGAINPHKVVRVTNEVAPGRASISGADILKMFGDFERLTFYSVWINSNKRGWYIFHADLEFDGKLMNFLYRMGMQELHAIVSELVITPETVIKFNVPENIEVMLEFNPVQLKLTSGCWVPKEASDIIVQKPRKEIVKMEQGKIYFISFGGTEIIVRYKETDSCKHHFFAHMHYWNGFESFHSKGYCVLYGIEEIRVATQAEKHNLLRFEIEKGTI